MQQGIQSRAFKAPTMPQIRFQMPQITPPPVSMPKFEFKPQQYTARIPQVVPDFFNETKRRGNLALEDIYKKQIAPLASIKKGEYTTTQQAEAGLGMIPVAGIQRINFLPKIKELEPAVNLLRNRITKEDVELIGKFVAQVEKNPKKNLGALGETVQSFAENVFGTKAASWTNKQLAKNFNYVLERIGQGKNSAGLGLSIRDMSKGLNPDQTAKSMIKDIPELLKGSQQKERQFITTVKESAKTAKPVKQMVEGQYIPKPNDTLSRQAKQLIKQDISEARNVALQGSDDVSVATANELIAHYSAQGDFQSAAEIANQVAPKLTELGRAVQAASLYDKLSPQGIVKYAGSILNKAGQKLDPADSKRLYKMAEKIAKMPQGTQRAMKTASLLDEVSALVPSPLMDKVVSVWKAGLLTGLKTSGTNIISNAVHGAAEIAKDIPAVAVDKVASLFTGQRTKSFTFKGTGSGVKEGFQKGWTYFKTGFDERNAGIKYDYKKVNFGSNSVAKALQKYEETVFRAIGAQDQPFFYGAKARSLYDQAGAAAINQGLKGKTRTAFIDKFVSNPPDEALKNAVRDAEMAVFQNQTKLGQAAKAVQNAPGGQIILPFGRTPAAVATQLVNYSPVGIVKAIGEQIIKGKFDQREFSQVMGRGVTGTGLFFIGKTLFDKGRMTLNAPTSERERRQWELEGKKPNSILVGGQWRQAQTLGPIGLSMVVGGYYQRGLNETGSQASALGQLALGEVRTLVDQSMLKGLSGWLTAINDPLRQGSTLAENTAGSVIPTFMGDVARATDPYQREIEGPTQAVQARIPGLRDDLTPKRNAFGEPLEGVQNVPDAVGTMADPFRSSKAKSSPLIDEMNRLMGSGNSVTPTQIDKSQSIAGEKVPFSQEMVDSFEASAGAKTKAAWQSLISSADYQKLADADKKKLLDGVLQDIRAVEKLRAARQANPDLAAQGVLDLDKDQQRLLINGQLNTSMPKTASNSPATSQQLQAAGDLLSGSTQADVSLLLDKGGELTLKNAQYDLAVDRFKRNNDYQGWAKATIEQIKALTDYQKSLDSQLDQVEILRTQNKIEDLQAQVAKYASYGGFKKGKKLNIKSLASLFTKQTKALEKTVKQSNSKTASKAKIPKLKFSTPKPVKIKYETVKKPTVKSLTAGLKKPKSQSLKNVSFYRGGVV